MFMYTKLANKKIEFNGTHVFLSDNDFPMDYCPNCKYFEDDIVPTCKINTGEEIEVRVNNKSLRVSCPLQVFYIKSFIY